MKVLCALSLSLSVVVFSPKAYPQAQTLLGPVDFESSTTGPLSTNTADLGIWSVSGTSAPLWRILPSGAGQCATGSGNVLAYNLGPSACNYQWGGPHNATAHSPAFVLSGQAPYTVSFMYMRKLDASGETTTVFVEDLTDGGELIPITISPALADHASMSPATGVLGVAADPGHLVRLRFKFAGNAVGNTGLGWFVDGITVTNSGPPPAPPAISLVNPTYGPNSGTYGAQVMGSNFSAASDVKFQGVSVPFFVVSDTEISVDLPATSTTGWVDVEVTSAAGTGTKPNGYDYFVEPVNMGIQCGVPELNWSGVPCIGQNFVVTTSGLGVGQSQSLLIDWSNINPGGGGPHRKILAFPMLIGSGGPYCPIYVLPDIVVNLGINPSYTFAIPNSTSMVGVVLNTQATISPQHSTTQKLKTVIGF